MTSLNKAFEDLHRELNIVGEYENPRLVKTHNLLAKSMTNHPVASFHLSRDVCDGITLDVQRVLSKTKKDVISRNQFLIHSLTDADAEDDEHNETFLGFIIEERDQLIKLLISSINLPHDNLTISHKNCVVVINNGYGKIDVNKKENSYRIGDTTVVADICAEGNGLPPVFIGSICLEYSNSSAYKGKFYYERILVGITFIGDGCHDEIGILSNIVNEAVSLSDFYIRPDLLPEKVKELVENYGNHVYHEVINEDPVFYMIAMNASGGFMLSEFDLNKKMNIPHDEFLEGYNDDVKPFYEKLLQEIDPKTSSDRGIALIYGEPGTGKTSFLRQLIRYSRKRIIYVPPDIITSMSNPNFINFLATHCQKCIMLIEDAENILRTREAGTNQSMSNILNASDGIMGDAINVQIIATFNAKLEEVDSALLRPGRLIGYMNFGKLCEKKTRKLVSKLHGEKVIPISSRMTLAEIYAMTQTKINQKGDEDANKTKFGFV